MNSTTKLRPEVLTSGQHVMLLELKAMPNCNVYEVDKVLNSPTARVLCGRRYSRVICVTSKGAMIVLKRDTHDSCSLKWARECKDIQQVYRNLKCSSARSIQPAQITVQFFPALRSKCFSDVFIFEDLIAKTFCEDIGRFMNGGGNMKTLPWGDLPRTQSHGTQAGEAVERSPSAPVDRFSASSTDTRRRSYSTSGIPVVNATPVNMYSRTNPGVSAELAAVIAQRRQETLERQKLSNPSASQAPERSTSLSAPVYIAEENDFKAKPERSRTLYHEPAPVSNEANPMPVPDLISMDDKSSASLVQSRLPSSVPTSKEADGGSQAVTQTAEDPFAYLFEVPPTTEALPQPVKRNVQSVQPCTASEASVSSSLTEEQKQQLSRNSLACLEAVDIFQDVQW